MEQTIESRKTTGLFDKYKNDPDPKKRDLAGIWAGSIGLQDVDGLSVSSYLVELAIRNIEGEITTKDVEALIHEHYKDQNAETI